jgi:adenylate kinase family enzyme
VNGELIVVTGAPGSGKSTVAELLASRADRPTVHLVTDQFFAATGPASSRRTCRRSVRWV